MVKIANIFQVAFEVTDVVRHRSIFLWLDVTWHIIGTSHVIFNLKRWSLLFCLFTFGWLFSLNWFNIIDFIENFLGTEFLHAKSCFSVLLTLVVIWVLKFWHIILVVGIV